MAEQNTKCSFIPLKKGGEPCAIEPVISYGEKKYCKPHSKTRQALQEKAKAEAQALLKENLRIQEEKRREEEERQKREEEERLKREEEEKKKEMEKEAQKEDEIAELAEVKKLPKFPFQKTVTEMGDELLLNAWGRFEDPKSNYVFFRKKCYGRQLPNGDVASLSPKDIAFLDKNDIPHVEEETDSSDSSDSDGEGDEYEDQEEYDGEEEENDEEYPEEEGEEPDEEETEEEDDTEEEED